jgi:predicted porin
MLEFSATIAIDRPMYKTLPGLSTGLGWGFSVGILPIEKAGIALGVNSTSHELDADTGQVHLVRGDSRRVSVYIQGQYRFLQIENIDFNAYLAATYNSINGGDKDGSYLNIGINPEDLGYSGYGALFGIGVSRPFSENYSLYFSGKYNLLDYSKHQNPLVPDANADPNRKGSSLVINFGILYRVDFAGF